MPTKHKWPHFSPSVPLMDSKPFHYNAQQSL